MLSEADVRLEIDESLRNKGWILSGKDKNVFTERNSSAGRADYILKPKDRENPLIIIEAKRKGKDLNEALRQATRYAEQFKSPIAYASDGSTIKTIHLSNLKPLILNGEEIDEFLTEELALQFLNTNEYYTIGKQVIKSRKELINIFASANKELRKEGLQAGIERFSEFCNILFLKIFSEEEETRQEQGMNLRIPKEFNWNYFKNKDGNELLSYVNDTVLKHFQKEYGTDIFSSLQIKNPLTLKRIIDSLNPLSLVDTNSDIKGDAFEYFLKAYLANQNKDLGEYFTPRHIVKTLVKLVNPKFGETVYDPFCGTGGILIEAFRHIYNKMPRNERTLQQLKQETIYGSEITKNAIITKMNMILTGDGHNNVLRQDSLKNPNFITKESVEYDVVKKFDCVITNMPFSLGSFDKEYSNFYNLGSANGNSLCIEHCFNSVDCNSENPRIGIIVPEGILFDKKFKRLREYIYKNSYVENIVSLPSGAFKPYTDVKTSILYLTKVSQKKETQKSVWHYTVKNDGYTLNTKRKKKDGENDLDIFLSFNDIEDEDSLLHMGFNKLNVSEIESNDYISIPNPYRKFEFGGKFENVNLGKFIEECELRNNEHFNVWSVTNDKGFVPAEDRFDEQVASENTSKYKMVLPNFFAYNPSRINVGSIAFNNSHKIGCVSPMYVVFKIVNENKLNSKYLYWLFQSEQFKYQINTFAFGSVRQTVSFDDFCKIAIPLPTIDEQERIVEELESYCQIVKSTTLSIDSWKPYLENLEGEIGNFGKWLSLEYGKSLPERDRVDGKYPVVGSNGVVGYHHDFFVRSPCIIVGRKGSAGEVNLIENDCFPIDTAFYLKWNDEEWNYIYLYYYLKTLNLSNAKLGTGVPGINRSNVYEMCIIKPSLEIQNQIVKSLEKEKNMMKYQEEIVSLFQNKTQDKLNFVWQKNVSV